MRSTAFDIFEHEWIKTSRNGENHSPSSSLGIVTVQVCFTIKQTRIIAVAWSNEPTFPNL